MYTISYRTNCNDFWQNNLLYVSLYDQPAHLLINYHGYWSGPHGIDIVYYNYIIWSCISMTYTVWKMHYYYYIIASYNWPCQCTIHVYVHNIIVTYEIKYFHCISTALSLSTYLFKLLFSEIAFVWLHIRDLVYLYLSSRWRRSSSLDLLSFNSHLCLCSPLIEWKLSRNISSKF